MTSDEAIVWKYPSEEILIGSQLIVGEGQQATFVKGGELLDTFDPGTHTLLTANLPLLNRLVDLPFGGETPFSAEVWFVNRLVKMNLPWGTRTPIIIMDSSMGLPVSVRSYGRWGYRVANSSRLLKQLVGSQPEVSYERLKDYLLGLIVENLSDAVADRIAEDKVSIFEIATQLTSVGGEVSNRIKDTLERFGFQLVNFNVESINIPEEELEKIQAVYGKSFEAAQLSKASLTPSYAQIKTFEVMQSAAENESEGNTLGALFGAGIGLGAGVPIGSKMGEQLTTSGPSDKSMSVADKLRELKRLLDEGLITEEQFENARNRILDNF